MQKEILYLRFSMLCRLLISLILPILLCGLEGCAQRRSTLFPSNFGKQSTYYQPPQFATQPQNQNPQQSNTLVGLWQNFKQRMLRIGPKNSQQNQNPNAPYDLPPGYLPDYPEEYPQEYLQDDFMPWNPQNVPPGEPHFANRSSIMQVSANLPLSGNAQAENAVYPPEHAIAFDQQIVSNAQQYSFPSANTARTNTAPQQAKPQNALLEAVKNEYKPLTQRNWIPNHARQATASRNGDFVAIQNIRNTTYRTATDYTPTYFDATYPLAELATLDLVEVPFKGAPSVAHVEISFGFADGRHLGVSVEARYEVGESYDPLGGLCNQFELIYVIADERDMIRINTDINGNDVYLYRLNLTQQEIQAIFVDVMSRANKLSTQPEFYHTVKNNCTSNIIDHINRAKPNAVPKEYRTLFPGYLDHLLYDVKLITTDVPTFKEARNNAKINTLAQQYGNTEYFSAGIRQYLY